MGIYIANTLLLWAVFRGRLQQGQVTCRERKCRGWLTNRILQK